MIVRLVLDGLPPSDNNAYRTSRANRRHLTREAAAWKREVGFEWLRSTTAAQRDAVKTEWWHVGIDYELPLYYKNGRVRKWDVSSHQKLAVDAVADAIGVDDTHCRTLDVAKSEGASRTIITVRLY